MTDNVVLIIVSAILTALGTVTLTLVLMTYNEIKKTIKEHTIKIAKIEVTDMKQLNVLKNHHKRIKNLEDDKIKTDDRVKKIESIVIIE